MVSNLKSKKMKTKCIHKDLIFYLDNELPEEKMIAVEKHLKTCADCQGFLAFLQTGLQIIADEKKTDPSPYLYTRLSARLDEQPPLKQQGIWIRIAQPAFFSLLLLAGIYGGLRVGSSASQGLINPEPTGALQLMNDFEAEPIESFLLDKL